LELFWTGNVEEALDKSAEKGYRPGCAEAAIVYGLLDVIGGRSF